MLTALLSLILAPTLAPAQQNTDFVDLFPKGSLDGFTIEGGDGKFEWDHATNELHGWGATGRNTFLMTKKQWSDFVFEVELKINNEGNSGVQFRSHIGTSGSVFGYQMEVDPSDRSWSGGIYDEGRRGWIGDLSDNPEGRAAFKRGEWNHYRIEARGPWLRTWVNGVPCAEIFDDLDSAGHIALQIHSGGTTDMRWRNARIRNLGGEDEVAISRAQLLAGVKNVPAMGTPGTIAVFGRSAFAVLNGNKKNAQPVAAAAHYGKGRAFAIAHNSYLSDKVFADLEGDASRLMRNALVWLTPKAGERSIAFLDQAFAVETLESFGFKVKSKVALTDLAEHDLLIISGGRQFSDDEAKLIRQYVGRGGSLMTALCPWGWQQVNSKRSWRLEDDLGDNKLLVPMGMCFADGYASGKSFPVNEEAVVSVHASAALDGLLAGERNVATHGLEHTVNSLPNGDMSFLWPLFHAVPLPNDSTAPHPGNKLNTKRHGLERLGVVLASRLWEDHGPGSLLPAPGSQHFPGAVEDLAPRLLVEEGFPANAQGWQSTGLYLAAADTLTVHVTSGSADGWSVRIGCHKDRLWHKDSWHRWPEITRQKPLIDGGKYANPFGGLVYLVPAAGAGTIEVQIDGAVQAPFFDRNNPIDADTWQQLKKAPGPWAELVGKYLILSVPTYAIQELDNPMELITFWDDLVASHYEFAAEPLPSRPERFVSDAQISAGYMHSGYPIMMWLDVVQPREGKLPVLLDLEELSSKGNWGCFHELGHNRQKGDWTFGGTGEVTCNLFSLHGGEVLCGIEPWQNPWLQNQKRAGLKYLEDGADFQQWKSKPGVALICYAQIQKEFGWEVFTKVFAEYRTLPRSERPKNDVQKINQWVVRMSLATGRDLRPFHRKWGWPLNDISLRDSRLDALKAWMPDFDELE
jgi:hypothetical protein